MGIAKIYNQKQSGTDINGIIQDYYAYAGENISAGDFVEFINGVASQRTETSNYIAINDTDASTAYYISAVALDDTRVFIAHTIHTGSIYVLYGVVCIINGASIIVGTDTLINDRRNCQYPISTVLLQDGRVFVTHTGSNTSNGSGSVFLWGVLCEVSNNVINVSQKQILVNDTVYSNSSKVLPNGSVFIAHRYGTSNYIYGMIVEISGTTITTKTDTQLWGSSTQSATELSTVLLDKERVFIINGYSSSYRLYGMICTINGTTLTAGTNTSLVSTTYSSRALSSDKIDTNKVFISHEKDSDLYGIVCSVSDTTITKGTDTQIFNYVSTVSSTLTIGTNKVLVIGINNTTEYKMFGVICDIENNTITKNTPTIMNPNSYTGSRTSPVLLRNNVFIAHSYNSVDKLYAQMFGIDKINNIPTNNVTIKEYETQVRKATTSDIYGVAKTSGEGGIAELPTNLVVNGDFSNGLEGWDIDSSVSAEVINEDGENIIKTINITPVGYSWSNIQQSMSYIENHKYYISAYMRGSSSNKASSIGLYAVAFGYSTNQVDVTTNDWVFGSKIIAPTNNGTNFVLRVPNNTDDLAGNIGYFKNIKLFDLTAIFGSGNEPTKEWCDENLTKEVGHKDIVSIYQPISAFNLIKNGDFSNGLEGWEENTLNDVMSLATIDGSNCLQIGTKTNGATSASAKQTLSIAQTDKTHIMYCSCYVKGNRNNAGTGTICMYNGNSEGARVSSSAEITTDTWTLISDRFAKSTTYIRLSVVKPAIDDVAYFKNVKCYDLTAMFGAGKEPTKEWCDINL